MRPFPVSRSPFLPKLQGYCITRMTFVDHSGYAEPGRSCPLAAVRRAGSCGRNRQRHIPTRRLSGGSLPPQARRCRGNTAVAAIRGRRCSGVARAHLICHTGANRYWESRAPDIPFRGPYRRGFSAKPPTTKTLPPQLISRTTSPGSLRRCEPLIFAVEPLPVQVGAATCAPTMSRWRSASNRVGSYSTLPDCVGPGCGYGSYPGSRRTS